MPRINWNDNKIIDENESKVYSQKVPDELELDDADECLQLKAHGLYIICGSSNSGKSNTIKNIVRRNCKRFHRIIVISPTSIQNSEYNYLSSKFVHSEYSQEIISNIVDIQKLNSHLHCLVILDDSVGIIDFNSKLLKNLWTSLRQYNLTFIISIQYLKSITPLMHNNCISLFVTKIKEHSLKSMFELTDFSCIDRFKEFMNKVCVNYNIVRLNLQSKYNKESISVFNCGISPKFRLNYK
jgi:hypothetical protein